VSDAGDPLPSAPNSDAPSAGAIDSGATGVPGRKRALSQPRRIERVGRHSVNTRCEPR
jgi:hypothetical protein